MKAKISLNADGMKRFFLGNGEKIVLGLTVIIFLLFLYSTITAKPLDDSKSPDAIKHESSQVVSTIQSPTWTAHRNEMGLLQTHYKDRIDEFMRPISGQPLHDPHEWDPPLFPELIKRVDPEIYPVEELQIAAGSGLVPYKQEAVAAPAAAGTIGPAVAGPGVGGPGVAGPGAGVAGPGGAVHGPGVGGAYGGMGGAQSRFDQNSVIAGVRAPGSDPQPKSYVIITGAVPVEKEVDEYRRKFEAAVPGFPDTDGKKQPLIPSPPPGQPELPHYFCFLIERSEVKDAKDAARSWTPILSKTNIVNSEVKKDLEKWATQSPEIVHPDDIFEPAQFGDQLFYTTWPLPPLFLKNWGLEAAHPKVKLNSAGAAVPENQPDANQNGNLDTLTPGRGGRMLPGMEHGVVPPVRMPQVPIAGPGGGIRGPGVGMMGGMQQGDLYVDPYKLFRFVDLTAEPGKTYRYRIQLLLYNPNYALREDCLDPKAIQAGSVGKKFTDWSSWVETPPVAVPATFHVLADSLIGNRPADVKARINLLAYAKTSAAELPSGATPANSDTWIEVVKDIADIPLGGLIYVHDGDVDKVLDMSSEQVRKADKLNIDTNQTILLDARNDKPLGDGKLKEATELLLMDSSGRVYNASRAADKLMLDDYLERSKPPADMAQSPGAETPLVPRPGNEHGRPGPGTPYGGNRLGNPGAGKGPPGPGTPKGQK
ncbi:MAG TPA: hypothetical protein VFE46_20075 [Pirellulales bacterium]|jgi:hypothetical protein|nr:hypothetical protein [Pirellulales bacterium]